MVGECVTHCCNDPTYMYGKKRPERSQLVWYAICFKLRLAESSPRYELYDPRPSTARAPWNVGRQYSLYVSTDHA